MKGSNTVNPTGVCADLGVADPDSMPGARGSTSAWTDDSGAFRLFGRGEYDCGSATPRNGNLWRAAMFYDLTYIAGLVPGYPLNRVFQFSGAVLMQTYTVTPGGPGGATLVIPGVTSFSDWFAGNLAATGIADWPRLE
jgi:hypothetical protein